MRFTLRTLFLWTVIVACGIQVGLRLARADVMDTVSVYSILFWDFCERML